MDEGLDGLMGGWIDGWMDKQIYRYREVLCSGCSIIWVQQIDWMGA